MRRRSRAILAVVLAVAWLGAGGRHAPPIELAGCRTVPSTAATEFAETLRHRSRTDAMMAHLKKLQEIADANGGNRALGTPGLPSQRRLRRRRPAGQGLRRPGHRLRGAVALRRRPDRDGRRAAREGQAAEVHRRHRLPHGVSGPLVAARADDSPGCAESDYDGMPVTGAVVLVDRGTCPFGREADRRCRSGGRSR